MKAQRLQNAFLPLIAVSALLVYILACTSFSPDDSKILYPAIDGATGAFGIAMYDRETHHSQMLLVPAVVPRGSNSCVEATILRPQWLADGQRLLVAWPGGAVKDDGLNLAVTSWDKRAPFRLFSLPDVKETAAKLSLPLAIVGERVFIMENEQTLVRLDLATGAFERRELVPTNQQITAFAGPDAKSLMYFENCSDEEAVYGRIDPDSWARTPLFSFTNQPAEGSFMAFDFNSKRLAFVANRHNAAELVILQAGGPTFTRTLGTTNDDLTFSSATFAPRGALLVASYRHKVKDRSGADFGLMEIPLNQEPIRQTVLLQVTNSTDGVDALQFQVSVSHDGKTAAVASTYLTRDSKGLDPQEAALLLVDLTSRNRKVTKIPAVFMDRTKR